MRKPKFNSAKIRKSEVVHLDYLRVYHEVLKYEDVLDIELDRIFDATVAVVQRKLGLGKLDTVPDSVSFEVMVREVMDRLHV